MGMTVAQWYSAIHKPHAQYGLKGNEDALGDGLSIMSATT